MANGGLLTFSSTEDEDDAAADADLDVLPGKAKMDEDEARKYINELMIVAGALHKSGMLITDAIAKAEVMMMQHNPNAQKLSKAVLTAITKHVLIHTKRGVK